MDEKRFMEVTRRVMQDETILPVNISIMQAWMLIGGLQLATRHPDISKYMEQALTDIARQFQGAIVEVHPEANELIEMGWNPQFDQPAR